MSGLAIVYAVYGDEAAARQAARTMVERRLAACANMLPPCTSFFCWEGRLDEAREVPVIFKTRREGVDALMTALAQAHEYDVPALLSWPVADAHEPFAHWVRDGVDLPRTA